MSEVISTKELADLIAKRSGMTRKVASATVKAIQEIIEEGVMRDGEVRVKGLGTFRLKWIQERVGRNPKTGETVRIPPHNRLVFLPEQSLKDYLNRDLQLLSYEIIGDQDSEALPETAIADPLPQAIPKEQEIISPFPDEVKEAPPREEERKTKRRIHWIVPLAIVTVAVLSVVFYFRNFHEGGDRRQETEVGGQQSEVGGQQSEVGGQQSAVSGQQSAVSGQQSAVSGQQSAVSGQQLETQEPGTRNPEPETRNPEPVTVAEGKRYFQLAREAYGNPFLWVLIYDANKQKSPDPDILVTGTDVIIPVIEGKPYNLTRNDSLAVSKGYHAVFEFYKSHNDPRADEFFHVAEKYKPK